MRTPIEMVKSGQPVHFTHAHQGNLWYATECGFSFPVPVSDIGEATFEATDKALLFLRYIRAQHAAPVPSAFCVPAQGVPVVRFSRYRQGNLWYVTGKGVAFPVPIAASATLLFPATADQKAQFLPHLTAHRTMIHSARLAQETVP